MLTTDKTDKSPSEAVIPESKKAKVEELGHTEASPEERPLERPLQQGDRVHLIHDKREVVPPDPVIVLGLEKHDNGNRFIRFIDPQTGKVKYWEEARCELIPSTEDSWEGEI